VTVADSHTPEGWARAVDVDVAWITKKYAREVADASLSGARLPPITIAT